MSGHVRRRHNPTAELPSVGHESTKEKLTDGAGLWLLVKLVLVIVFGIPVLLLIVLCLLFSPKFEALPNELQQPPVWEGPLAKNDVLLKAERLFNDQIFGPESLVVHEGHMYTGTADGKILDIYDGNMRLLTTLGKPPCGGWNNEPTCGRPLGMRMAKDHYLYVIDTYMGLFRVNPATGDSHLLLPAGSMVDGRPLMFLNDLDIDSDGIIYLSDSTKYQRREFIYSTLECIGDGRVLRYDPQQNTTETLMLGLYFANGVQLSKDGSFLLVAETTKARILKYHLKGIKKGTTDVFADNLPGIPDNVRRSRTGGFWVGFAFTRKSDAFSVTDFLAARPAIRTFLSRIPIQLLMQMTPPPPGLVVELDNDGKIIRSLHDSNGETISGVSEVEEDFDGTLYLGSYRSPYIGKVKRPQ